MLGSVPRSIEALTSTGLNFVWFQLKFQVARWFTLPSTAESIAWLLDRILPRLLSPTPAKLRYYIDILFMLGSFVELTVKFNARPRPSAKFYNLLAVPLSATQQEIHAAYKRFSKKNHPDRGGKQTDFIIGRTAFEILNDPGRCMAYDYLGEDFESPAERMRLKISDAILFYTLILCLGWLALRIVIGCNSKTYWPYFKISFMALVLEFELVMLQYKPLPFISHAYSYVFWLRHCYLSFSVPWLCLTSRFWRDAPTSPSGNNINSSRPGSRELQGGVEDMTENAMNTSLSSEQDANDVEMVLGQGKLCAGDQDWRLRDETA